MLIAMVDTTRPFLRATALKGGISRAKLAGPAYRQIFPKVYIGASTLPHQDERNVAALLLHPPGAFLSHTTAAKVYGVAVPDDPAIHVSVKRPRDRRWVPGLKPHVAPATTVTRVVRNLPVSSPLRLFVELAAILSLVDLVAAGDSLLKRLGISRSEFVRQLDHCHDYWSGAARRAAAFLREEVDSAMESRLRMLIVLAGLLEPEVNWKLYDDQDRLLYRLDLAYPILKIAIEYDGGQHAETWLEDVKRREYLDEHGWRVITVVAAGIYTTPAETLDRICAVLAERGAPVEGLDGEWRHHFPQRRKLA